tara:strand:+ start:154 stop:321 length:168 start_codon:yes stop_codon:yes gene_type:complete
MQDYELRMLVPAFVIFPMIDPKNIFINSRRSSSSLDMFEVMLEEFGNRLGLETKH